MKKTLLYVILLLGAFTQNAVAQVYGNYYKNANGKTGAALKTALASVINEHKQLVYTPEVWEAVEKLDIRDDGKILDRYSNISNFTPISDRAGSYSKEGDVYNREHSFPKIWFKDGYPMYVDIMHLVASDGFVNNKRGNHPFGETTGNSYKSANAYSKLGSCTTEGYTGTVFEPADEWKGDFARIYFYMVTCYEDDITTWSCDMLDGQKYPGLSSWALKMLLRWAKNDPVSEVEKKRNDGVYDIQGNRNPFVDFEGLEQFVWGQLTDSVPDLNNYQSIYSLIEDDGSGSVNPGGGDTPGGGGDLSGAVFSETFNDCKGEGGNDGTWSGISKQESLDADNTWEISNGWGASGCARFGTGSKAGSATTPSITVSPDNTYILTFRAGAWNGGSESTILKLTLSGGTFDNGTGTTTVNLQKGAFSDYTLNIKVTGTVLKITFSSGADKNSRFFLDDVVVKSTATAIHLPAVEGLSARQVDAVGSAHSHYYDLMGHRVDTPVRGVYLYKGKKVLKR